MHLIRLSGCHPLLLHFGVTQPKVFRFRGMFMSSNYPPPQQPAGGGNPYAQQPAAGGSPYAPQGAPQAGGGGNPFAQQGASPYPAQPQGGQAPYGQQPFNGAAFPPPSPYASQRAGGRENVAMGILAGVVAMVVAGLAYGGILRAMSSDDGSIRDFRLLAILVGALIAVAVGKVGGRNPVLPVVALVLALVAIVGGELYGTALTISHYASTHGGPSELTTSNIIFDHFGDLWKTWKHDFGVSRALFLLFGGGIAFGLTKRLGEG
jgi:hypothetical protein